MLYVVCSLACLTVGKTGGFCALKYGGDDWLHGDVVHLIYHTYLVQADDGFDYENSGTRTARDGGGTRSSNKNYESENRNMNLKSTLTSSLLTDSSRTASKTNSCFSTYAVKSTCSNKRHQNLLESRNLVYANTRLTLKTQNLVQMHLHSQSRDAKNFGQKTLKTSLSTLDLLVAQTAVQENYGLLV